MWLWREFHLIKLNYIQYNENKFLEKCKNVKVDGLIVVDLPYPENKKFAAKCKKKGINFIQLVSPTTSSVRLKKIIKDSHDMLYYISMLSTTGGKLKVSPRKILERYSKIKNQNKFFGRTECMTAVIFDGEENIEGQIVPVLITNSNQNNLFGVSAKFNSGNAKINRGQCINRELSLLKVSLNS